MAIKMCAHTVIGGRDGMETGAGERKEQRVMSIHEWKATTTTPITTTATTASSSSSSTITNVQFVLRVVFDDGSDAFKLTADDDNDNDDDDDDG
jgi:hypothetical protein